MTPESNGRRFSDNEGGAERRRHTRIDFDSKVEVLSDLGVMEAASPFNISLGGIRVWVGDPLPEDTPVKVVIFFNGASSDLRIEAEGFVVRQGARLMPDSGAVDGLRAMAVKFTSLSDDSYFHLRNLVMYNAVDPDSVEAEF